MSQPVTTMSGLFEINPVLRAYAEHVATSPVISLDSLWDFGGSLPGREPAAWMDRRAGSVTGRTWRLRGCVIAYDDAAWQYLVNTDPEILGVAICEAERAIAADPMRVLDHPNAISVTIARSHLVNTLGMTDADACRYLVAEAMSRTADLPELHRESIVARLQRSIHAVESSTGSRPPYQARQD